jgi:hypothetical protein
MSSSAGDWDTGLGGFGGGVIADSGAGWDTGRGGYSGLGLGYVAPLPDVRELQWHLDSSETAQDLVDPSGVVVAVLDTGVSCAFSWDAQGYYVGAQSLWASSCIGGWDFVNGDWNPADDHQHGTMMASIIAGSGPAWGMAPGVSLMPIKVLDQHNSGYEWDLIQGIHHAVVGGADVISMSLSFGLGYVPSPELLQAIEEAHAAGVAMVAATGNDGESQVAWPAASPRVISVGSHCADLDSDGHVLANYSNWGAKVDVVATGGCLEREVMIGAGWPDGILAESIGLNDPLATELWFGAGTSEATAVVAGALAQLMASGATSDEAVLVLQDQANALTGHSRHLGGAGAGAARARQAVEDLMDPTTLAPSTAPVHASLLPWLKDNGNGTVTPRAWVTVWRNGSAPVAGERVVAQLWGNTSGILSCTLSASGTCELVGPSIAKGTRQAWLFQVAGLNSGNVARRPLPMFFASDGLERVVQGVATQADLQGAVLGLYWPGGSVSGLGITAPSYTVVDTGSGIATSPMGLRDQGPGRRVRRDLPQPRGWRHQHQPLWRAHHHAEPGRQRHQHQPLRRRHASHRLRGRARHRHQSHVRRQDPGGQQPRQQLQHLPLPWRGGPARPGRDPGRDLHRKCPPVPPGRGRLRLLRGPRRRLRRLRHGPGPLSLRPAGRGRHAQGAPRPWRGRSQDKRRVIPALSSRRPRHMPRGGGRGEAREGGAPGRCAAEWTAKQNGR